MGQTNGQDGNEYMDATNYPIHVGDVVVVHDGQLTLRGIVQTLSRDGGAEIVYFETPWFVTCAPSDDVVVVKPHAR